jgi:hypothetical protein
MGLATRWRDELPPDREERAAKMAEGMPEGSAELLELAADLVEKINRHILDGSIEDMQEAAERYGAIEWKLNGGSFFGCRGGHEAAGNVLSRHCAASPGEPSKWGQSGEFLIASSGMRALVVVDSRPGGFPPHFEFYAVDRNRPFISQTGYCSHYADITPGYTVEEAAIAALAALQKERKPIMIAPDYLHLHLREVPEWMGVRVGDGDMESFEEEGGQLGFSF